MFLKKIALNALSTVALLQVALSGAAFALDPKPPVLGESAVPIERTLTILKPDSLEKHHIGAILAKIEEAGLSISALKMTKISKDLAEKFYQEHQGKPFFHSLVTYMTRGPVVVAVLEGERAVSKTRQLMGTTDPMAAAEGTIRKAFAASKTENAIHGSDSIESAAREIPFFFSPEEIFQVSR